MIICFNCNPATKDVLDRLLNTGEYRDYSDVVTAAIENLSVLHSKMSEDGSIIIGQQSKTRKPDDVVPQEADAPANPKASEDPGVPFENEEKGPATKQKFASTNIPDLFRRPVETAMPVQFATIPIDQNLDKRIVFVEDWIFGQYNRLLPAKAACRALANISTADSGQKSLANLAIKIANDAVGLGRYLSHIDKKRNLGRDEATSVAFPKDAVLVDFKSIQRFASQFVGTRNKEGRILGLPSALKLIGTDPENSEGVALTAAGWAFAKAENPLLDRTPTGKIERFSDEEIALLLEHIIANVPTEAFAYRTILTEVGKGQFTPEDIDSALLKHSRDRKKSTGMLVSTQRSGAISRMADLDLIGRSRTGTRVSYLITPRGKELLRSPTFLAD